MVLTYPRQAVGIFPDYQSVEAALKELEASGFPMNKISLIGRDVNNYRWHADFKVRDRFDEMRNSFPNDRATLYDDHLSRGHYLVAVEGTQEEIRRAEAILNQRGVQDWGIYDKSPDLPLSARGTARHRRSLGVFPHRREAEAALHELRDSGFPMDRVSVIKRDADENDHLAGSEVRDRVEDNKADEGAKTGAVSGGVLGGLTGLLVGLGTLAIPGIGPIMLAGATATTIATTLAGTAIGAVTGGLLGALIGLGIPEERARVYNERVARGDYLVIAEGTDEELARAEAIFRHRNIEEYGVYDMPETETTQHTTTVPTTHHTTTVTNPKIYHSDTRIGDKSAVGVFSNFHDAELAVADLRNGGFSMNQITLVGNSFEQRDQFSGTTLRDRFDNLRLGLPDERTRFYNDRALQGKYIIIVNGTEAEIHHAASLLSHRGIQDWEIYDLHKTELGHGPVETSRTDDHISAVNNQPDVIIVDHRDHIPENEQRNF
jgi:hypothetical protein